jgi:hypothetical protein
MMTRGGAEEVRPTLLDKNAHKVTPLVWRLPPTFTPTGAVDAVSEEDYLGSDWCERRHGAKSSIEELRRGCAEFFREHDVTRTVVGKNEFAKMLRERGFEQDHLRAGNIWYGVAPVDRVM